MINDLMSTLRQNLQESHKKSESDQDLVLIAKRIIDSPESYPPDLIPEVDAHRLWSVLKWGKLTKPKYRNFWIVLSTEFALNLKKVSLEIHDQEAVYWFKKTKRKLYTLGGNDLAAKIFLLVVLDNLVEEIEDVTFQSLNLQVVNFDRSLYRRFLSMLYSLLRGSSIDSIKSFNNFQDKLDFLTNMFSLEDFNKMDEEERIKLLELVESELNGLNDDYEKFIIQLRKETIIDLLRKLNSNEQGKLLDHFFDIFKVYWERSEIGVEEIQDFKTFIQNFQGFLQQQNISPVFSTPLHKLLKEELSFTEYFGSEIETEKMVKVRSPGWKFQGEIFSKPKVVEADENEK